MPLTSDELQQRLAHAVEWAREAGELILGDYRSAGLRVDRKADASPVTAADRNAERLLRERVAAAYPRDGFLGEEHGEKEAENGLRWIVDPIDGTKAFVAGVPMFGTLIGLEAGGEVLMGVCRFPALNEVMYAANGCGAHCQIGDEEPATIRVSGTATMPEALFCYTEVDLFRETGRMDAFHALQRQSRAARGWGDCYGHMLVATGRAEFIADPLMNAWDAAALVPILREAGGSLTAWNGEETIYGGDGVSVNAALKDAVLAVLRGAE
ncbi:MAG: inositol monophosphatase family protein [Planctomycetaceae bacterium]